MGRLSGFRCREIVSRLKQFGFVFDRQAAGNHETGTVSRRVNGDKGTGTIALFSLLFHPCHLY